jgi:predicted dehydrogenase
MNVVIDGLGSIAQKHILALRKLNKNVKIYAIRSSSSASIEKGIENLFSYSEIEISPDLIIISNPTQFHRDSIREAIKFGVPIMIEKPVLHSLEQNDFELAVELTKRNIETYVACNLRFHPILRYLKTYLQVNNKRINEVNVYCGSFFPDWRPNRDYKELYSAKNMDGGGIHLELIHEIDYTCWLFGFPINSRKTMASKSSINIEAPDYAHYLLEYPDYYTSITLNFYRKTIKRNIEILFEDDTWNVDLVNSRIINDKNEIVFSSEVLISDTYLFQMQHMFDIVNNNATSLNTYSDALETLKVCLS